MSLHVDSLITFDGVCSGADAVCATVSGADGTAGEALFRVYSMAANVDVDNNSVYKVRRMPMTQQGRCITLEQDLIMEVLTHLQKKYSLDDVQQYSRRFSSLLLLRRAHTALQRVGDGLTRTGLLTIGVSYVLKVCLMWYCWLRSFKSYSHRLRPPKSRHDTPPHRAQIV